MSNRKLPSGDGGITRFLVIVLLNRVLAGCYGVESQIFTAKTMGLDEDEAKRSVLDAVKKEMKPGQEVAQVHVVDVSFW